MPIGEIYKESEKLYETEEKIKLQTQNSATSLVKLFIEHIDILAFSKKFSYKNLTRTVGPKILFKISFIFYLRFIVWE